MKSFAGGQTSSEEKDLDFLGASLLLRRPFHPSFPRLPSVSSLNSSISAFYRDLLRLPYFSPPAPAPGLSLGTYLRAGLGRISGDFVSCPPPSVLAPDYGENTVVTSASGCHSTRIFAHRYEPYPSPGALCDNDDICEPKKSYSSR